MKTISKVALITGASGGIGQAIAARLARDGIAVGVHYSSGSDAAEEVVKTIVDSGGVAKRIQADLSSVNGVKHLFQDIEQLIGPVDILVNNAGVGKAGKLGSITEEEFDHVFTINVKSVYFALQEASRRLKDNGRIINISSSTTRFPSVGLSLYAGSKISLKLFTEVAALELGSRGITVNSVLPGPTVPGMFEFASEEVRQNAASSSPFSRLGQPDDIADVVSFLASDDARWVTGQQLMANGGATI